MLSFFKCVLCSVLINVHELVLKMNVENMHGEKINTTEHIEVRHEQNTSVIKTGHSVSAVITAEKGKDNV